MQVFCRKAGGRDPLGDVVKILTLERIADSEEDAVMHCWETTLRLNRSLPDKIATLHCGDTLLEVKTGKLRSLAGKLKSVQQQPDLDMPSISEPRLL